MILIDADVILIEKRYPADPRFPDNRRALDLIRASGRPVGMSTQAFLEAVGVLSFNTPAAQLADLADRLQRELALRLVPDPAVVPKFAGCNYDDVVNQLRLRMALGDAVQAVQIAAFLPTAEALLTWNAKHFTGKLVIPVLTPAEWLAAQVP